MDMKHMHHDQQMKMGDSMEHMDGMSMDHSMGNMSMMHMGNLKQKFWYSLILSLPILFCAPAMGVWLPFQFSFSGSQFVVIIFATILFFYGGWPFLTSAIGELKEHQPAMMTLISLGITTAYGYSLYAFIINNFVNPAAHVMDFFWELATLILIMLLGHWVEMNSLMSANDSVADLASLLPDHVQVKQDDQWTEVPLNQVAKGDVVLVKAGASIPLDGQVIDGQSAVNESLVTGETRLLKRKQGSSVIGGSINNDQTLTIKVTKTAQNGFIANVSQLVQTAQTAKSNLQSLADKVSGWLFYAAVVVGLLAFIIWSILNNVQTGFLRLVTVLVIACPHALGLAIPLVNACSTSLGAKNGLLVRNRKVIDLSPQIDYVVLDKTGTLTEGKFQVHQYESLVSDLNDQKLLALMAALERQSSHPIAKSIVKKAQQQQVLELTAQNVTNLTGHGLKGEIAGKEYQLVNQQSLKEQHLTIPELAVSELTLSYLVCEQQVLGYVAIGDQLKPSAKKLIQQLKEQKITPLMLTGDNESVAKKVADQLEISEYKANLLPQDKNQIIQELQQAGHHVLMTGDGINDAPSLAQADIGVAIGAGTDVAIDAADVVLVKSDPLDIMKFFLLAKNTHRKTIQNLWWGAGYNIIALPLAAGILAPIGIILSPALGAILMSLSTVVVAINASLLKF
ncbi:copper-translocating P-type ATPase [Bombilactobacillus folatiphilus]